MGFIIGRKNKPNSKENNNFEIKNNSDENNINNSADNDDEDDFAEIKPTASEPVQKIEKKDELVPDTKKENINVKRDEFRDAAKKEFIKAGMSDENQETYSFDKEDNEEDKQTFDEQMLHGDKDELKNEKQKSNRSYEFKKKSVKIACFAGGIIIAAAAGLYIYGYNSVPVNVIADNVYIETVPVGGLTYDEAVAKLKEEQLLSDRNITLSCANNTYSISGSEVGLVARVEDTVDYAMKYGKTGNRFIDGYFTSIQVLFPHTIIPKANADEALLREKLVDFGRKIYGERIEHSLEFGEGVVIASSGKSGFDTNTDTAYNQIIESIENEKFTNIDVDLKSGPPADLTVDQVDLFVYKDPVDAYYKITNNEIMLIAEETGRYINRDEVANIIPQVVEGAPNIKIPYYISEAAIKSSSLKEKLFNATLGSYSTNYSSSGSNRAANVANAAKKINGKILAAGEVFSFNSTVGKRTVENGFYTAPEYSNGQTVQGIGGGTCQVSSTLYNAVLYADLGIVYRLNHMFPVSYCPLGQDATVSDSGVDFKFVNNTDYPIKIQSTANGSTITVSIIGTQRDVPHTVKISNSSSAVGADTSVNSVRRVYNPSGELIREESLGNSYYMAH